MDVYQIITDRIIFLLEKGVVPWHKSWTTDDIPKNFDSKREYHGINTFLLGAQGYTSPWWLTYKQAQAFGGQVRKGEKGSPVVFWKQWEIKDKESGEEKKVPILRYYTVFNAEQIDGIEFPEIEPAKRYHDPIPACDNIVSNMPNRPTIVSGNRPCFIPSKDTVNMPELAVFDSPVEYYSTLFHELVHSTGHESRLNRRPSNVIRHFGDTAYAKEELVAEMGAAFLCGAAEIVERTVNNSAAYIGSWLKALRNDNKMVVFAAAQAQKAADYILNR